MNQSAYASSPPAGDKRLKGILRRSNSALNVKDKAKVPDVHQNTSDSIIQPTLEPRYAFAYGENSTTALEKGNTNTPQVFAPKSPVMTGGIPSQHNSTVNYSKSDTDNNYIIGRKSTVHQQPQQQQQLLQGNQRSSIRNTSNRFDFSNSSSNRTIQLRPASQDSGFLLAPSPQLTPVKVQNKSNYYMNYPSPVRVTNQRQEQSSHLTVQGDTSKLISREITDDNYGFKTTRGNSDYNESNDNRIRENNDFNGDYETRTLNRPNGGLKSKTLNDPKSFDDENITFKANATTTMSNNQQNLNTDRSSTGKPPIFNHLAVYSGNFTTATYSNKQLNSNVFDSRLNDSIAVYRGRQREQQVAADLRRYNSVTVTTDDDEAEADADADDADADITQAADQSYYAAPYPVANQKQPIGVANGRVASGKATYTVNEQLKSLDDDSDHDLSDSEHYEVGIHTNPTFLTNTFTTFFSYLQSACCLLVSELCFRTVTEHTTLSYPRLDPPLVCPSKEEPTLDNPYLVSTKFW